MTKLSTIESLRNRLGEHDMGPINAALGESLESASAQLSTHLRTNFDRASYVDYFSFNARRQPYVGEYISLSVSHGFVLVEPAPTFYIGPTLESVVNDNDPYTRAASRVGGQLAEGRLIIPDRDLYQYMRDRKYSYGVARYTAGFEVQSDYGLYKNVPGWLQELSEIWAAAIYNKKAENINNEYKKGPASILSVEALARPHIRAYPASFRPIL